MIQHKLCDCKSHIKGRCWFYKELIAGHRVWLCGWSSRFQIFNLWLHTPDRKPLHRCLIYHNSIFPQRRGRATAWLRLPLNALWIWIWICSLQWGSLWRWRKQRPSLRGMSDTQLCFTELRNVTERRPERGRSPWTTLFRVQRQRPSGSGMSGTSPSVQSTSVFTWADEKESCFLNHNNDLQERWAQETRKTEQENVRYSDVMTLSPQRKSRTSHLVGDAHFLVMKRSD